MTSYAELSERIRECAAKVGGGNELARKTNIPRRTLEYYLTGESEPKAKALAEIAIASDVSLDWLILGNETHQLTQTHISKDTLKLALETTEEALNMKNVELSAEQKSEMVVKIYDLIQKEQSINPARLIRKISDIIDEFKTK